MQGVLQACWHAPRCSSKLVHAVSAPCPAPASQVYWNSLRVRFWAPESRPYHLLVRARRHVPRALRMAALLYFTSYAHAAAKMLPPPPVRRPGRPSTRGWHPWCSACRCCSAPRMRGFAGSKPSCSSSRRSEAHGSAGGEQVLISLDVMQRQSPPQERLSDGQHGWRQSGGGEEESLTPSGAISQYMHRSDIMRSLRLPGVHE